MSLDLLVFHRTPVVSDTTPVAMAPLQPEGDSRGVIDPDSGEQGTEVF